jgi:hypothetical protein
MAQENGLHNITFYWMMEAVPAPVHLIYENATGKKQCPVQYSYNK